MNSRKIFLSATGIAIGIALASLNQNLKIILLVASLLALAIFCVVSKSKRLVCLLLIVCISLGFASFSVNMHVFHNADANQKQVHVVGTVTDEEYLLRDCKIDGKKVSGYINFEKADYQGKGNVNLKAGTVVEFECVLQDYFVDKDGMYTVDYKKGYRYYTTQITSKVKVVEKSNPTLDESARIYVKDMLSHYLDEDSFAVVYAMVLGDTSYIEEDTLQAFRDVGIAHVFAVSGLHVGFVVMLVNAFVKKRKKLALCLTMAVVFLYAWVCNFSPSIMRAMIMTFLLLLAKALGREPDFLSALSTAACIILLVKPFYLFDVGFQMSVGAVLGIDFVTNTIKRVLKSDKKWLQKIISAFCVSVGATLGTLPFMLQYFEQVSIVGILANVLVIPVVSVVFMATLLCLIVPVLFWWLPVIGKAIDFVVTSTIFFQSAPLLQMPAFNMGIIAYFVILYLFSGHCRYKPLPKNIVAGVMAVVLCVMIMLPNLPDNKTKLSFFQSTGDTFCVTAEGQNYFFSKMSYFDDMQHVSQKCGQNTTLFITDFDELNGQVVLELAKLTNLEILSLTTIDYFDENYVLFNKNNLPTKRIKTFVDQNVQVVAFDYLGKVLAIVVSVDDFSFAYVDKLTDFQRQYVLDNMQQCDAYYSVDSFYQLKDKYPNSIVVTKNYVDSDDIYSTYCCGNFTIFQRGAKMVFAK